VNNVLRQIAAQGGENNYTRLNTTWYANADLWKGLNFEARFNYNKYMREDEHYDQWLPEYSFRQSLDDPVGNLSTLDNAKTYRYAYNSTSYTGNLFLRYNRTLGNHDVGALLGYEAYRYWNSGFDATKKGLIDWTITDITSAAEMESIGGNSKVEEARLSYFARVNYAFDGKYMLEANFRSDASSRFAPGHRGSFFPSVSAGWRISEESFFEPVKPYVNYLKLRASYGTLGNIASSYYSWQALYKKVNNVMNESVANGVVQSTIQNLTLSWEKRRTIDIGLSAAFLKQRLNIELDYYNSLTHDILTTPRIPITMGNVSAPVTNSTEMRNQGVELTIGWNDKVGNFHYGVSANLMYNSNRVTKYMGKPVYEQDPNTLDVWGNPTWKYTNLAAVSTGGDTRRVEGHEFDEFYLRRPYSGSGTYTNADGSVNPNGGPRDGMIRTKADLEWVKQMIAAGYSFNNNKVGTGAANIWYGQMVMADINNDGNYGSDDDKEFTGKSQTPKWVFGLNINAEWKGIDLNMSWSGRAGSYHYINQRGVNTSVLSNQLDALPANATDIYYSYDAVKANSDYDNYDPATDASANIYAKYPRLLSASSITPSNTFYLYNSSYLKLKSLQIGYTLPAKWTKPARISNLRVFVSGENLLTIKAKGFPGVDPELGGSVTVYPIARVYSACVSVTF
jgi:TonB-linked SusC/RagA family outer membrane protein